MVHSFIKNQWYLKQTEYDQLIAEGKATKLTWWCKNLTTGQFFNYDAQIGHRISGNAPFEAELDLEEGEYLFSVGDYNVIDPNTGRHCSQVFYVLVTEDGAQVCKKNELPSYGGSGPVGGGNTAFNNTGGWGVPSTPKKAEYFQIPGFCACMQDMSVHPEVYFCDNCEQKDVGGAMECANCVHSLDVHVKKV